MFWWSPLTRTNIIWFYFFSTTSICTYKFFKKSLIKKEDAITLPSKIVYKEIFLIMFWSEVSVVNHNAL